jgi:hypothetical protein
MTKLERDTYSRTRLIELQDGLSPEEADARVTGYIIQIDVGTSTLTSRTRQAMLLTAVNCAKRAAPGGVKVRLAADDACLVPWGRGEPLSSLIEVYGGTLVDTLSDDKPTIVIGNSITPAGSVVMYATWNGWAGGTVDNPDDRLAETIEMEIAGVLAGAIGVSESLQHLRGYVYAGRRPAGASLWRPDLDWRAPKAVGPRLQLLPRALWLAGLGHLGQAYAWTLGMLPHGEPSQVTVMLQDYERVVEANESTGLLTTSADRRRHKTRVVASKLEELGFDTFVTERRFDESTKPNVTFGEPTTLLAGFDDLRPRRQLENEGFAHIVDAGLGTGNVHYLDMLLHTFPGSTYAADAFPDRVRRRAELPENFEDEVRRRVEEGEDPDDARCGVVRLHGSAAAAAFVGATTSAFVIGDVLRAIHGGRRYDVLDFSLRTLLLSAAESTKPTTPGIVPTAPIAEFGVDSEAKAA